MATTTEETVVITNVKTGATYANDVEAASDVADPTTETSSRGPTGIENSSVGVKDGTLAAETTASTNNYTS
jgi:hypothetical protein